MTTVQNNPARMVTAADIALADTLVDEMAGGGYEVFLANEKQWSEGSLACFLNAGRQPELEPEPVIDPVGIYDKWNASKAKADPDADAQAAVEQTRPAKAPVNRRSEAPKAIDVDAIYDKWNSARLEYDPEPEA